MDLDTASAMIPYIIDLIENQEENITNEENQQTELVNYAERAAYSEYAQYAQYAKHAEYAEHATYTQHTEQHTCSVCFEKMGVSVGRIMCALPCAHVICQECLNKLKPKKCPQCRKPFRNCSVRKLFL